MKEILMSALLLFMSYKACLAQDFRPGLIVTLNRDTVFGEIDYQSKSKNSLVCRFRKDDRIVEYGPEQLIGYRFSNDKYFSATVVPGNFVEAIIIGGALNLYRDLDGSYLIQKTGGDVHKLEAHEVDAWVNGKKVARQDLRWKGTILYLMADCQPNQNEFKSLSLDERKLSRLVTQYNKCRGASVTDFKASRPWAKLYAGVIAGVVRTNITLDPNGFPFLVSKYSSTDFSPGLLFELSSPRLSERIAFQAEVLYSRTNFSSDRELTFPSYSVKHHTTIDLTTISIPVSVKYLLINRTNRITLLAGMNFDRYVRSNAHATSDVIRNDGTTSTTEISAFDVRKGQAITWVGLSLSREFSKINVGVLTRYFQKGIISEHGRLLVEADKLSVSVFLTKK